MEARSFFDEELYLWCLIHGHHECTPYMDDITSAYEWIEYYWTYNFEDSNIGEQLTWNTKSGYTLFSSL